VNLRELEGALFEAVTGAEPAAPSDHVHGRLFVYRDAYVGRFVEVLADDFPRLARLLGDDAFRSLVRDYVGRWPSTNPSLRHLGAHLPSFVAAFAAEDPRGAAWPWLADLAALEWARVEAFDAPDASPLSIEALAAFPPERFPELRLALAPGARLLEARYPVHDEADGPLSPRATTLVVWRRGHAPLHRPLDAIEARALHRLARGRPLADVCEVFEGGADDARAAPERAFAVIAQWVVDEMLVLPVTAS
jgi:hypothetical protein